MLKGRIILSSKTKKVLTLDPHLFCIFALHSHNANPRRQEPINQFTDSNLKPEMKVTDRSKIAIIAPSCRPTYLQPEYLKAETSNSVETSSIHPSIHPIRPVVHFAEAFSSLITYQTDCQPAHNPPTHFIRVFKRTTHQPNIKTGKRQEHLRLIVGLNASTETNVHPVAHGALYDM